jgi:hypothetical protein
MTQEQKLTFARVLIEQYCLEKILQFHHGDCVGADADAHRIVRVLMPSVKIHIHPPDITTHQAEMKGDIYHLPKEYLTRNRNIVHVAHILIATPFELKPKLRSGTWSTIRYAVKSNTTPCRVILPKGDVRWACDIL